MKYTEEETQRLLYLYSANKDIENIAQQLNRPVRSIRSKLVKEGVYINSGKPSYIKKKHNTKKELLNELEKLVEFDTTGFSGATKEALEQLISFLK